MAKNRWKILICCCGLLLSACGGSAAPEAADEMAPTEAVTFSASGSSSVTETKAMDHPETVAESTEYGLDLVPAATEPEEALPEQTLPEETVPDAVNFFSFRSAGKYYPNDEGQVLFWQSFTEPAFYSPDTELHDWVNGILNGIIKSEMQVSNDLLDYAQEELERLGTDFYHFSHYLTLGVGRHDTQVASVLAMSSMYSGGPHPSTIQTATNLDMGAMTILKLEDVLEEGTDQILMDHVLDSIHYTFAQIGEAGLYPDYTTVVQNALTWGNMTSHWYFNDVGLVIFFNQYELAPYAAGIIKAEIPYYMLDGVLRSVFMPEQHTGTVTGVQVSRTQPSGGTVLPISYGTGDIVYIRVEGKASCVQLSDVFFVEDTPVGESMLFSANYLDDSVVIALQGDWQNTETVYGIQYSDEQDSSNVLYCTAAEVWQEIN